MRAVLTSVVVMLAVPGVSGAQDRPAPWVEARGFASISSSINVNEPVSGLNQLRVFDFEDRRIKLDVGELVLQRAATVEQPFGFRADLVTGGSIPRVSAASGLFRDPSTGVATPGMFDIQQAYATYVAGFGSGLRLDAGKFTSHVGAEVIEGYDGYGDTYSRGYLFGYAEPATHTGVRASYTFNETLSALVSISNGWDNVRDNNSGKSIGAQAAVVASSRASFYVNYIGGPERTDSGDWRNLLDLIAVLKPADAVTVTTSYDYGRETNGLAPGVASVWQGASGTIAVALAPRWGVAGRAEIFSDRGGVRTGTSQLLAGITLSPSFKVNRHLVLRNEVRIDRSTAHVFESRGDLSRRQATAAFNAVVIF